MNTGLVYVFSGEGKGKTSAALGVATRSLLLGEQVVWVAFYKQESWGLSEAKLRDKFPNLTMSFMGKGFSIGKKTVPVGDKGHVVVDTASMEEHKRAAESGLELVRHSLAMKPFLLVMDEVLNAVSEGLLDESAVVELLACRNETHIILTGRVNKRTSQLLQESDLVTECRKIKHPYDDGMLAVKGLDY